MTAPGGADARGVDELIAANGGAPPELAELARLTETADAERFRDLYGEVTRYVTDLERWYLWNGFRWEPDVPGDLKTFALTQGVTHLLREEALGLPDEPGPGGGASPRRRYLTHALATESAAHRRAVVRCASALPELQLTSGDLDARDDVLACRDELVELTGTAAVVRPCRRDDLLTHTTRGRYRPEALDAPPGLVRDYLATFLPDEERRRLLFKTLGACLVGGNPHRLFIIIQGGPTTGKTQLVEAVVEALGPDHATVASASVFRGNHDDRPRPDILNAVTRRLVFLSEASRAWELHGDRVKDLTGGGTITARRMRSDEFEDVRPRFTPILVTNALPRVVGRDPALLRRMVVFNFTNSPDVEDPSVRDRFVRDPAVHDWVVTRLVRGWEESQREGLTDVVIRQGLATMTAYENLSHLGSFFRWLGDTEQLTAVDDDERRRWGVKSTYVTFKELYDRYVYWVREYGGRRAAAELLDYEEFNEQLRNAGWEPVKSGAWRWVGRRLASLLWLHSSNVAGPGGTSSGGSGGPGNDESDDESDGPR